MDRITTQRLILRPVLAEDRDEVVAALNDLGVSGWLAVVPHPYAASDFDQFQTEYAKPGQTWAMLQGETFAGIIGLEDDTLGYWLKPAAQGLGLATEAARGVLAARFADDDTAILSILSGYFTGNARSAKVLAKLGFTETGHDMKYCRALGQDRDHVCMSLAADAFRAALALGGTLPRRG